MCLEARKKHYNEFQRIQEARKLMEEDDDEDEDEEPVKTTADG